MSQIITANAPVEVLTSFRGEEAVRLFFKHFRASAGKPSAQKPSLASLEEILHAFSNLPYENLSKIIKFCKCGEDPEQRLRLPDEIMQDHIAFRLGGTCFSLTFFLQTILLYQGFTCYPVMADMRAGANIHCALIVMLEGVKHLVDPGYVLQRLMALDPNKPRLYHTAFAGVELRWNGELGKYDLFTFNREQMKWRYSFADRPAPLEEFLQHWQASFQRNSMHGLCLSRATEHELVFVHKDFMRLSNLNGKRNVSLKKNYHATIREWFGIDSEYIEQAQAALASNMANERLMTESKRPTDRSGQQMKLQLKK